MSGGVDVRKVDDKWYLNIDGDDYSKSYTVLTDKKVENLIDQINEAACQGAPWTVYEESTR